MNKSINYWLVIKWIFVYIIIFVGILGIILALNYYDYSKKQSDPNFKIGINDDDTQIKNIIYASTDANNKTEVFLFNPTNLESKQIISSNMQVLDYTAKEKKIIYLNNNELFAYDFNTNETRKFNLPVLTNDGDKFQNINKVMFSPSGKSIAILVGNYDKNSDSYKNNSTPQPQNYSGYIGNLENYELTNDVNLTKFSEKISNLNSYSLFWNNEKNLVYYYKGTNGSNCESPINIFVLSNQSMLTQQNIINNTQFCPSFSNDLSYFALLPKNLTPYDKFRLYNSKSIDSPTKEFNFSSVINVTTQSWQQSSIIWSNDNKKIFFSNNNTIYRITPDEMKIETAYQTDIDSSINSLVISSNDKNLYFVKNNEKENSIIKLDLENQKVKEELKNTNKITMIGVF